MNPRKDETEYIFKFIQKGLLKDQFQMLMISGFPGCGKTHTIQNLIQTNNLNNITQYINCRITSNFVVKKSVKIVILDEVDQLTIKNKLKITLDVLKKQNQILICISNSLNNFISEKHDMLQFKQCNSEQLYQILSIVTQELGQKETFPESIAKYLVEKTIKLKNSDPRYMIKCAKEMITSQDISVKHLNQIFSSSQHQKNLVQLDYYQQNVLRVLNEMCNEKAMSFYDLADKYEEQFDEECPNLTQLLQKLENIGLVHLKMIAHNRISQCEINNNVLKMYAEQLTLD